MQRGDSFVNFGNQTVDDFLDSLAVKEPVPGGGALAGVLAALSTSLGTMVLAYTQDKKQYADHASLHSDCNNFLQSARIEAMELATEDADAYLALNSLWKLDADDPLRLESWGGAIEDATGVPIRTMELCKRILTTLETMVGKTNKMLVSDLATAAILARAAIESAAWTARINLPYIDDNERRDELEANIYSLRETCNNTASAIDDACRAV